MNWLVVVILAHLLNAVVFVIDKFLLSKAVKDTFSYVAAIGLLGAVVILLIPFVAFEYPGIWLLFVNLITGVFFIAALLYFFQSLQRNEASRIVPLIGSTIPVITFILSFLFLGERLDSFELLAFLVLIVGTFILTKEEKSHVQKKKFTIQGLWGAFLAAFFFALSFVLNKYIFDTQPFWSGFIWIRIGSLLTIFALLLSSQRRLAIKTAVRKTKKRILGIFLGNQAIGALGFILISYAISLASVTLVNALQGVQYALLLILAIIASLKYPKILQENMSRSALTQKFFGVILIGAGLFILSFYGTA